MVISNCTRKKIKELRKNVAISINSVALELVNEYKYLGILLDESLKYNGHIKMIKQKVKQRAYLLKKIRNIVGHKEALTLYKSSILPFLDQGDIFFSSSDKQLLNSLQVLQNNCLRTVYGRRDWPGTTQAHLESNLLFLKDRRDTHLLKLAQCRSFINSNRVQNTGQQLRSTNRILLKETKANNAKYGKSYIVRAVRIWNSIPEEIKLIPDLNCFKTRIKKEMLLNNLNFPE